MRSWLFAATAIASMAIGPGPARADSVADFYKGKTVSIVVGVAPGGIYSNMAQTIARHLGRHIPGEPTLIVQNMPGAGGTVSINHVYNIAPKDGTVLLTPNSGLTKRLVLGEANAKYDPVKFNWLGGWGEPANECTVMKATSPALTIEQAREKEVVLGAIGTSSTTYMNPFALNAVIGTKFKLVTGYGGGAPIRLAMERGEVHGFCGQFESWTMGKPEWLREGKLVHLVQFTSARTTEMPDVPTAAELGRNAHERQLLGLLESGPEDRAMVTPPGVPADRVAALEKAYMAMLADPKFVEDAEKQMLPVVPIGGQDIRNYVERLMKIGPEVAQELRRVTGQS